MTEPISFVKAIMQFFSIPTSGAAAEIKKLTTQDRRELSDMLMPIIPHVPPAS